MTLPSLLMDLRPCYEGFAGIPQESRLLFATFARMGLPRFGGLASGLHHTSRRRPATTSFEATLAQTQAIITQDTKRRHWPLLLNLLPVPIRELLFKPYLVLTEALRAEKLDLQLDPVRFEDYLWMKLFDNTLAPTDRPLVQRAEYFLTEMGHEYARSLSLMPRLAQRKLECQGWDVFFAASVSPYRVPPGTAMMVRYYDALPLLSPHTIGEPWPHAASHARMLERNMQEGAHFYCDSEPVRQDILTLFPQSEPRVHTIPVTVSPELFPDPKPAAEVGTILRRRSSPATRPDKTEPRPAQPVALPKLFMSVSTLEPRKNYLKLFGAFDLARTMTTTPIQLVIVANTGWRSDQELAELRRLVRDGLYHLSGVPANELRTLYSSAHAVVAPSRAEGFDYSGAEAMACGTPLIASDIAVHRWVYGEAATYFDPYSVEALARIIADFADLPRDGDFLAERAAAGLREARRYHPNTLAPVWEQAIIDVAAGRAHQA